MKILNLHSIWLKIKWKKKYFRAFHYYSIRNKFKIINWLWQEFLNMFDYVGEQANASSNSLNPSCSHFSPIFFSLIISPVAPQTDFYDSNRTINPHYPSNRRKCLSHTFDYPIVQVRVSSLIDITHVNVLGNEQGFKKTNRTKTL